jgi:predicted HTH domain antitoxin
MSSNDLERDEYRPHWDELISLHEAAKLSGLSPNHLRRLVSEAEIWGRKIGRDWFTTEESVREYLALDRRPGPKPKADN